MNMKFDLSHIIYSFICGLFNGAVSSSDCIASNNHHNHNALRDLGLVACSDLIFTNPIVFSVDVPGFFPLMVGSSG
jgi:hypothetical protein